MTESMNEQASGTVDGLMIIENSGEPATLFLPEAYRPCEGTWKEFVGDAKRFCRKLRDNTKERSEEIGDSLRKIFRRNRSEEV